MTPATPTALERISVLLDANRTAEQADEEDSIEIWRNVGGQWHVTAVFADRGYVDAYGDSLDAACEEVLARLVAYPERQQMETEHKLVCALVDNLGCSASDARRVIAQLDKRPIPEPLSLLAPESSQETP